MVNLFLFGEDVGCKDVVREKIFFNGYTWMKGFYHIRRFWVEISKIT